MGYDIHYLLKIKNTIRSFSLFVSFPLAKTKTRSVVETMNITTVRAGVALKFGQGGW
jgi:hypothetical protein